jgi:hypothetical protein
MGGGSSWFSPTNVIYLLLHIVLLLIGVLLTRSGGPIAVGIGASLIAAGVTGWVLFAHIRLTERQRSLLDMLTLFGFVKAFEGRAVTIRAEYDERLERVRDRIDILGYGLRALREDYRGKFPDWKKKANVRILIIDPEFPNSRYSYAKQRDKEEEASQGIDADVKAFLAELRALDSVSSKHLFEVRLYTCLPSFNIFRIDDELFWGPYLIREPSRNAPTFLVRRGGVLYERFTEHFDRIWQDPELSHAPESIE